MSYVPQFAVNKLWRIQMRLTRKAFRYLSNNMPAHAKMTFEAAEMAEQLRRELQDERDEWLKC